jgi:hypothetical protein
MHCHVYCDVRGETEKEFSMALSFVTLRSKKQLSKTVLYEVRARGLSVRYFVRRKKKLSKTDLYEVHAEVEETDE